MLSHLVFNYNFFVFWWIALSDFGFGHILNETGYSFVIRSRAIPSQNIYWKKVNPDRMSQSQAKCGDSLRHNMYTWPRWIIEWRRTGGHTHTQQYCGQPSERITKSSLSSLRAHVSIIMRGSHWPPRLTGEFMLLLFTGGGQTFSAWFMILYPNFGYNNVALRIFYYLFFTSLESGWGFVRWKKYSNDSWTYFMEQHFVSHWLTQDLANLNVSSFLHVQKKPFYLTQTSNFRR